VSIRVPEPIMRAAIDRLVENIVSREHPLRIILFGSVARGDMHTSSDLDICIIVEKSEDWFERARRFRALTRLADMEVEPHVYSAAEFAAMISDENPLALRIAAEGKILYEQQ
jgi:predicted nucleotidyltransferase